jgi:hypothetical protein
VAAAILTVGIGGCSGANLGTPAQSSPPGLATPGAAPTTTPTTTSAKAAATDYGRLMITAADLSDAEDTFTQRSQAPPPKGVPGASAFFVNDKDDRAIGNTVLIYPDAATATATLHQSAATLTTTVTGGAPKPISVGTDGVVITGTYPDENKAVTLMYFTEGRALVRLEFQSATGDVTTDKFVTAVGKMQQIALRVGLAGSP